MRWSRLLAVLCPICVYAQPASVLNMSKDLVTNGIASSNLAPNTPTLDARPLFEAAVAYATKNAIPTVTADTGSYYFLSLHGSNANQHALITGAADLYFARSNRAAIQCTSCTSVTLQNFALDYLQLPFTQVTITSVDAVSRNFTFQTISGYQMPSEFNARRTPPSSDEDAIWMFVFRNGVPLPQTGRLAAAPPFSGNTIHVINDGLPWTQQSSLAAIQPGDILVLTDRGGPPAINFVNGQGDTVRNVSVYSSGQIGIYFGRTLNPTADRNQVIPRPGTDRLISTNADGIHTSFSLANTTFSNNIVRRTCDDALAIATEWIATIDQPGDGKSVVVTPTPGSPIPVGAPVSFISLVDATVLGTANIVSETTSANSLTLVLDHAVAGLVQGYGVMDADPAKRASGSVIRNNTVQEGVFSRGIWLSGVENVTVTDNLVQRTSNTGILVQESISNNYFSGPSSGITIKNNIVDSAISFGPPGAGVILSSASINVIAANNKNAEVLTTPYSNVTITGNRVTNSPRSAIRMENVNVGQIANNAIQGYGLSPAANVYIIPSCCEKMAQYLADFTMPVVISTNTAVTASNNSTTDPLIASASTASYSPKLAPGSLAFAYAQNLVPAVTSVVSAGLPLPPTLLGVSVSVTDSAGVTRLAPIVYISPNAVSYVVPDGTASGNATVRIGSFSGGTQIDTLAPGFYSANSSGQGVAAAYGLLAAANSTTSEPVFECGSTTGSCVSVPLDFGGPTDQLYVILYGTGMRNASSLHNATATVGGISAFIDFIGGLPTYPGLDQVNVGIPRSLAGAGEVPVIVTVDGQTANVVKIRLK